jgi:hypothetical protein
MTPLQIIALRAPQWAGDPRLSSSPSLLDLATSQTGNIFQGEDRNLAIALRTLHFFALESLRGGNPGTGTTSGAGHAGAVSSESEGSLSKSFSVSSKASTRYGALSTTVYGQELIELTRSCGVLPRTRAMDSSGTVETTLPGYYAEFL